MSLCRTCEYALYDGMCLAHGKFTLLDAPACDDYKMHLDVEVSKLKAENAELRELVRDLWPFVKAGLVSACLNRECCLFEECDANSEYECLIEEHMAGRMRELGVEVTDGD